MSTSSNSSKVKPKKTHPYYDFGRILSYNAAYTFVCGGRGLGKTYGAQKRAIRKAIDQGKQFIYLRRYKPELASSRNTFFDAVAVEFPDWDFRTTGSRAEMASVASREDKKREWQTIGYFIALSVAQNVKSVAFPLVELIIFDEFIKEKGATQYLPDEAKAFNNFYSTVDRWQDKTQVLFLANAVSIMNPYFTEYGIRPDQDGEMGSKHDGFVAYHFPEAAAFATSVYETRFGKFIQGTEYADYAVGNNFADNNENLIGVKNGRARYLYTLETKMGTFSVWHNLFTDEWYVQERLPKNQTTVFTMVAGKMSEDKLLLDYNSPPLQVLRTAFRSAKVSFDKPSTRNSFVEVFRR